MLSSCYKKYSLHTVLQIVLGLSFQVQYKTSFLYTFFLIETITIPNKRPRNFLAVVFFSLDDCTIPTHLK